MAAAHQRPESLSLVTLDLIPVREGIAQQADRCWHESNHTNTGSQAGRYAATGCCCLSDTKRHRHDASGQRSFGLQKKEAREHHKGAWKPVGYHARLTIAPGIEQRECTRNETRNTLGSQSVGTALRNNVGCKGNTGSQMG